MQNTTAAACPRCGGSATANPGNGGHLHDDRRHVDASRRSGRERSRVGAQNLYNFAPLNYFQRPDERYIAGAFADYEISAGDQAVP